jgi:hypothetical protein
MAFCKPDFIIIESNYFQSAIILDDFEALVREIYVRGSLLRSRNVIVKVVSSKMTIIVGRSCNCGFDQLIQY